MQLSSLEESRYNLDKLSTPSESSSVTRGQVNSCRQLECQLAQLDRQPYPQPTHRRQPACPTTVPL